MTNSIREFVRRETKEHIDFENYNELFYILYNLIQLDIDLENVEGISEQLIPSLDKLASQNYCRDDEITAAGKLINCLEAFSKKCLYILQPQKYKDLEKEKKKSKYTNNNKPFIALARYLKELGTPASEPDEEKRNDRTQIMYEAKELRNETLHNQYSWSNRKCFHIIGLVLTAYLIIVEKNKEEMYVALRGKKPLARYSELDLTDFGKMNVVTIRGMLDVGITCNLGKIKTIKQYRDGVLQSVSEFDNEGRHVSSEESYMGGKRISKTCYDIIQGGYTKQYDLISYENVDKKNQYDRGSYFLLKYNENGQNDYVESHSVKDNGTDQLEAKISIEGTVNGGICIIHERLKRRTQPWYEKEEKISQERTIKEYNCYGQLLRVYHDEGEKQWDRERYIYEDNVLVRKETPGRKAYVEVLHIQDEDIYRAVDAEGVSGEVLEKRLFENDRPVKIIKFYQKEDGSRAEAVTEYEYY